MEALLSNPGVDSATLGVALVAIMLLAMAFGCRPNRSPQQQCRVIVAIAGLALVWGIAAISAAPARIHQSKVAAMPLRHS